MIREKLSIFDKRIEKEGIFIDIDVDKYETLDTINSKEQQTTNQLDEQQNSNNNQFSSASSGSEEEEPQEKIILCTKCNIELPLDPTERRKHYKSPEHVAKLMESLNTLSTPTSTPRLPRKSMDNSPNSISRADVQRSQKVFFRSKKDSSLIAIYRQALAPKGEYPTHTEILSRFRILCQPSTKIMIVLQGGGHFVASIYQNNECIRHKTFKAYIVRGKAGGVQSQADKRQGQHKSVGAQMRRQNQIHFEEKIGSLLKSWKSEGEFDSCLMKFVHVPHYARKIYFNDELFDKSDLSIRTIPFSTVKPGLLEANRVFNELTTCTIYKGTDSTEKISQEDIFEASKKRKTDEKERNLQKKAEKKAEARRKLDDSDGEEYVPYSGEFTATCPRPSISNDGFMAISNCLEKIQPKKVQVKNKSRERRLSEIENGGYSSGTSSRSHSRSRNASSSSLTAEQQNPTKSVQQICSNGNIEEFNQLCTIIPYEIWLEEKLDANGRRPLHVATRSGNLIILKKLLELGANPETQDNTKLTPYQCANDKTVRNVFRRFRHDKPNSWHWPATKIDSPLSIEDEENQKAKKKAKNKKNMKNKKEKQEKLEQDKKSAKLETNIENTTSSVQKSSIELERERRLAAIQKRLGK